MLDTYNDVTERLYYNKHLEKIILTIPNAYMRGDQACHQGRGKAPSRTIFTSP